MNTPTCRRHPGDHGRFGRRAGRRADTGGGIRRRCEEIVVTARKRDESLQSVPVTVDVFTEQAIQSAGIESRATSSPWCRT